MPDKIRPSQRVLAAVMPLPLTSIDLLRQVVERLYGTGDSRIDFSGEALHIVAPADGFGPIVRDDDEFELPAPDPGDARIRYASLSDGRLTMTLEEATEAVSDYLLAQATFFELTGGINYVETSLTTADGKPEYTVIMQKAGNPTPHELRTEAETRERSLRKAASDALDHLRNGDTTTAERMLAEALGE